MNYPKWTRSCLSVELWLFKTSSFPKRGSKRLDLVRQPAVFLSCAVRRYPRRRMARVAISRWLLRDKQTTFARSSSPACPFGLETIHNNQFGSKRNPTLLQSLLKYVEIIYWHFCCSGNLFISHLQSSFWPIPSASLCALLEPLVEVLAHEWWCNDIKHVVRMGWRFKPESKLEVKLRPKISKVPGHKMRWRGFSPGWISRKGVRTQPAMALSRSGRGDLHSDQVSVYIIPQFGRQQTKESKGRHLCASRTQWKQIIIYTR